MDREEVLLGPEAEMEEFGLNDVVKAFAGVHQRHVEELASIRKAMEEMASGLREALKARREEGSLALPEALPDGPITLSLDEQAKQAIEMIIRHNVRTSARLATGIPIKSLAKKMVRKATWQFGGPSGLDELRHAPTLVVPEPVAAPINLGAMLLASDIAQRMRPPVEIPILRSFATGGTVITEGGLAPELGLPTVDRRALTKEIISAFVPVTSHLLEQSEFIMRFIEMNLTYEITRQVERHVLGVTGSPIVGILQTSGVSTNIQDNDGSGNATELDTDTILESIGNVASRGFQPNLIVMLGSTWYGRVKKQKTTTREYVLGSPLESPEPDRLWGIPVLPIYTDVLSATQILVGEFSVRTMIMPVFEDLEIVASSEHADLFARHMVAIRGSIALNFTVIQPGAFELIQLANNPLS